MREAPGDLLPRLGTLRAHQFRVVFQDHDEAVMNVARIERRDRHAEVDRAARALDLEFATGDARATGAAEHVLEGGLIRSVQQFGHGLERIQGVVSGEGSRRFVVLENLAVLADRDHARRDALEDRVDEATPIFDFAIAPLELAGLGLERLAHGIEGFHEARQFVSCRCVHAIVQLPSGQFSGRSHQRLDRSGDLLRREDRQPHGQEQHEDRDQGEDVHVRPPHDGTGGFEFLPLVDLGLHERLLSQDFG